MNAKEIFRGLRSFKFKRPLAVAVRKRGLQYVSGALLVAAACFVLTTIDSRGLLASQNYRIPEPPSASSPDPNVVALEKISQGIAAIAKRANKALVFVSISKTQQLGQGYIDPFEFFFGPQFRGPQQQPRRAPKQQGLGSGFFIDVEKGYIVTNNHVVEDADEIHLKTATGETYKGKVLGRDKNSDIAVVQITDKDFKRAGLDAVYLSDSDKTSVGDIVIAVGAPFGLEASLSFGVISALGRQGLSITAFENFIQTDAAINPGNSGGPLLNTSGHVIGVNTAIFSKSGASNGIGFAVPSNLARKVAEQLINEGKLVRGYIGVQPQPIDPDMLEDLGLKDVGGGALLGTVEPKGPAEKAGLQPGDVIVQVEGRPIKSHSDLVNTIGLMRPGTSVSITYVRDGKKLSTTAKLEKFPEPRRPGDSDDGEGDAADNFGITVSKSTPNLREKFGVESKSGVIITSIVTGSAADQAGLEPGDAILQVNNKRVESPTEFYALIKGKRRLLIRLERQGQIVFMTVKQ